MDSVMQCFLTLIVSCFSCPFTEALRSIFLLSLSGRQISRLTCVGHLAEIHFGSVNLQILYFAWLCISPVSLNKLFNLPFAKTVNKISLCNHKDSLVIFFMCFTAVSFHQSRWKKMWRWWAFVFRCLLIGEKASSSSYELCPDYSSLFSQVKWCFWSQCQQMAQQSHGSFCLMEEQPHLQPLLPSRTSTMALCGTGTLELK